LKSNQYGHDEFSSGFAELSLEASQCITKETCGDCIKASPTCAWCSAPGNLTSRCDTIFNLQQRGCPSPDLHSPSSSVDLEQDEELSDKADEDKDPIQLRPQRISLQLRPKYPVSVKVSLKQALDYPVDLYYLMDLSKSMEDDKAKLAELGNILAGKMKNLTSNFRLGFGSFVDKVVMPYVSTVPEKLIQPCTGCAAPYGFKNHMKLDTEQDEFVTKVKDTQISGNLDAPEGGFDAIMQAIVCKNEIGWREKSRKLLVFSTDAGFHYAGDGKLGGIVKPNDGECHLNSEGVYTESINQDYPSISQINRKVQEHHVNIIFAVTENQFHIYNQLTGNSNNTIALIEGSSAGQLESDSSNVVQLIEDEYKKITSAIELKDNATSDVTITYTSSCLDGRKEQTNVCRGLRVGDSVTFDLKIQLESCPSNRDEWNQTIKIYPIGLKDALFIDLSMICDCDCERDWNSEENSESCNFKGTAQCGICKCNPGFEGERCECDSKDLDKIEMIDRCRRGNDTKLCSGRGTCRCGICECYAREAPEEVSGQFCECDNFSCDRHDGQVCAGPDHGTCSCGKCVCKDGWEGPDCSCKVSQDDCINPKNGKICSGHGKCVCGQCVCDDNVNEQYTGHYCEQCPTCKNLCDVYKDCVQCRIFGTGPMKDECDNCTINPIGTTDFEVLEGEEHCVIWDDNDCIFNFKYKYDEREDAIFVVAQNTKDCPQPVDVLAIVIGVIVGIVIIGLALLLIWKLLTTIQDRREVAKFNEERMNAKWETGVNPIFKKATTTFKNPIYNGK
ncbi:Integrin beta-1, partial [Blomia tropicalis]